MPLKIKTPGGKSEMYVSDYSTCKTVDMIEIIRHVYQTVGKKYNLSLDDVERVLDSQFRTLKDSIEDNKFNTINIKHIGKFTPNEWGIKRKLKLDFRHDFTDDMYNH